MVVWRNGRGVGGREVEVEAVGRGDRGGEGDDERDT